MAKGFEVLIVGGGIAGVSLAAQLAPRMRVGVIERETQTGYHATGRSAALFSPVYGPAPIRALTRASHDFFRAPPAGFSAHALLSPRAVMMVARDGQVSALAAMTEELSRETAVESLDAAQARAAMPLLRESGLIGAMLERSSSDIDVHALLQGWQRAARTAGAEFITDAEVYAIERVGDDWLCHTRAGEHRAPLLVNAGGAWGDELAQLAGVAPSGLQPKRRTAMVVQAPTGLDVHALPMAIDVEEQFYLKPDAGRLLLSPANEDPSPPCDAQPEELDIAICADRIERAFELQIRRIDNRWAGLRSFVADKVPVLGYAPDAAGFFWLVGQGGYGIQSAPATAQLAAALLLGQPVPTALADEGVLAADFAVQRSRGGS